MTACCCLYASAPQAAEVEIKATEQGKIRIEGDLINAGGDVTYGLDEEKLNALLEQREDRLIKKLLAAGGNDKKRRLLEDQLKTVQAQKADNFRESCLLPG